MKTIFVHDHILRHSSNDYYTTGGLSDIVTMRYTNVFGNVTVICRSIETDDILNLVQIKNKCIRIKTFNTNMPSKKTLNFLKNEILSADKIIIRLPSLLGVYAGLFSIKYKKKYLVEVVGSAFESYWYKSLLGKLCAFPYSYINKKIIRHAKYALYVSNNYLQKKYPNYNNSIGCSDVILDKTGKNVLHKRINRIKTFNNKKIIIGTLAQYNQKYKGHKTVFETIRLLKNEGYNIEYRLAGSGDKSNLEKIIKEYKLEDCVVFCGLLEHKKVSSWLDELDIYIQPSLTEGMPRSVIEAISRGCPTIVSNAGGMYEVIEPKYVFNKNDYKGLYKMIKNINAEELTNMAKRNHNFSLKFQSVYLNDIRTNFYYKYLREK